MKNGFLMMETIISILLILGVIATLLKIENNNLNFLNHYHSRLELHAINSIFPLNNQSFIEKTISEKVYLKDIVQFKNDNLRKKYKDIKINIKNKTLESQTIKNKDYNFKVLLLEKSYELNKKLNKKFYLINLN